MTQTDKSIPAGSYLNATGVVGYGMTNDYMFRAVLQKNEKVLKGLICSLLHYREDEIQTVQIMNPIELGKALDEKVFILDIKVLLNDDTVINLEMQMTNERNWEERSLSYLCRSFDQLYRGQDYLRVKPAIHIGFLNFAPYEGDEEFYATYKMMNVKNHRLYSDKFVLSVVDLTHIELATEEDKDSQLDYWAKLFTATTWEELKMIAEKNASMLEATQTLYELNSDELTQEMCYAREEYYRRQRTMDRELERLQSEINLKENEMAEKDKAMAEKDKAMAEKDKAMAEKDKAMAEKDKVMAEKDKVMAEKDKAMAEISEQNEKLMERIQELEKQLELKK